MLRIRPYIRSDGDKIAIWTKDETEFRKWCADRYTNYPICGEDITLRYAPAVYDDSLLPLCVYDEKGLAGHIMLRFIDEQRKVIRFGFVIVNPSRRQMGYGKEMLQLALKVAFELLKADKVTLGVFDNNEAAYRCYCSVGFRKAQCPNEKYPIMGELWECIEMEITREEY